MITSPSEGQQKNFLRSHPFPFWKHIKPSFPSYPETSFKTPQRNPWQLVRGPGQSVRIALAFAAHCLGLWDKNWLVASTHLKKIFAKIKGRFYRAPSASCSKNILQFPSNSSTWKMPTTNVSINFLPTLRGQQKKTSIFSAPICETIHLKHLIILNYINQIGSFPPIGMKIK